MVLTEFSKGYRPVGTKPQREPVGFQELLPLYLKNKVAGRGGGKDVAICMQEMSVMLSCLKTHDYKDVGCSTEVEAFQKCATEHKAKVLGDRERERKVGTLGAAVGSSKLNFKQINILLKKFPHPK